MGVEPATTEPKVITTVIGQCLLTVDAHPQLITKTSQATRNVMVKIFQ
jgi:hypothetical protein